MQMRASPVSKSCKCIEKREKRTRKKKGQEVLFSPHYLYLCRFSPFLSFCFLTPLLPRPPSLYFFVLHRFFSLYLFLFSFLPLKSLKDDLVTQFHCARENIPIILADSLDRPSLTALVASTHVVLSAAGPFSK